MSMNRQEYLSMLNQRYFEKLLKKSKERKEKDEILRKQYETLKKENELLKKRHELLMEEAKQALEKAAKEALMQRKNPDKEFKELLEILRKEEGMKTDVISSSKTNETNSAQLKAEEKKQASHLIFDNLSSCNEKKFKQYLDQCGPNVKHEGIPLIHFVVRNTGPHHLQSMLDAKVDVNMLSEKTNELDQTTALQWISGLIFPKHHFCGWPRSYNDCSGMLSVGMHGERKLDTFIGSANAIMKEITKKLLLHGAKMDFYSACALGEMDFVKKYLKNNSHEIHAPGPDGSPAISWAARRGQNAIISLLINYGANVNQINLTSELSPLEEATLLHGNTYTMHLLISHGAHLRKGIIAFCKNNFNKVELLLKCVGNPISLITVEDLKSLGSFVYFQKYLEIFLKYNISLAEIDNQLDNKDDDSSLAFSGCNREPDVVRLLILLGVNFHRTTKESFFVKKDQPAFKAHPLVCERLGLDHWLEYRSMILERMAILFLNGASIKPLTPIQPHPINSLKEKDLIDFLVYLHDEVVNYKKDCLFQVDLKDEAFQLLKNKLEQVSKLNVSQEVALKFKALSERCQFPTLLTLTRRELMRNRFFMEPQAKLVLQPTVFLSDKKNEKDNKLG